MTERKIRTDRAADLDVLADIEAEKRGHKYVGSEHILLAMLATDRGIAAGVLAKMGVTYQMVSDEFDALIGRTALASSATDEGPDIGPGHRAEYMDDVPTGWCECGAVWPHVVMARPAAPRPASPLNVPEWFPDDPEELHFLTKDEANDLMKMARRGYEGNR